MHYFFGDYILDTQRCELRRAGVVVKLERLVFNGLLFLVQHCERVVTRQELFEHLWPDQFVSDAALERCIATARRAVGDSGRAQRVIQTLHGRGYRFVATVEERTLDPPGTALTPTRQAVEPPLLTPLSPARTDIRPTSPGVLHEERKLVTVLCGALVHPTALAERLGLETLHRLVQPFFARLQDEVQRYEGTLQPFGDTGFVALFGTSVAQEDHAWRAVRTGLRLPHHLREACVDLATHQGTALALRLGAHTGQVVVGHHGDERQHVATVTGDTGDLAVRLQYLAEPDTLLVSETTLRLVQEHVQSDAFGLVRTTGQSDPVMAYTVLVHTPPHARIGHNGERGRSPFVGRGQELATLHELLAQVEDGQGQVVGMVGEPGMGKSRLLYECHQRLHGKPVTYLEGHCRSHGCTIPYLPVRDLLRQHCGLTATDAPEAIRAKVCQTLQAVGREAEAEAPYLLQLLGVPDGTDRLAMLTPEARKDRTFEVLRQLSLHSSQQRPLVIAIENLHWIDPTSEAYFTSLVEQLAGTAILLLTTFRPGYPPPWMAKSYVTQIALHRLTSEDSLTVVRAVAEGAQLAEALVQDILARAEGNPLFLEELTRAVLEQSDGRAEVTVPQTIQGVLTARIDRLPTATKRVLQTASVFGREVSSRLFDALWEGPGELTPHLQALIRSEFLHERAGGEESVFVFKHALTQEVAYESLLWAHRQVLHAAAGEALETRYAERLEEVYEQLARHYAKTDQAAKAVEYLMRAAEKAARGHAHAEAVTLLQEALGHVERLPDEARDRRGVELVMYQARSLLRLGRNRERLDLLLREQERLERLQDPALAGPYLYLFGITYNILGDRQRAIQHQQRALAVAAQCGDEVTMGQAYFALAREAIWSGQYRQGVEHSQQAIGLLERTAARHELGMAWYTLAASYVHLGEFALSLDAAVRANAMGDAMGDRRLQNYVALVMVAIHILRSDWEAAIAVGRHALENPLDPHAVAYASGWLGFAYLEQGDVAQAIPLLEQSVQQLRQFQNMQMQGRFSAHLSQAYLARGDLEPARDLAQQALDISTSTAFPNGIAHAQRALGCIDQASGALVEAATHWHAAMRIFASTQERWWVGRVHLDLAALAHAQGNQEAVATHLTEADALFRALQVPTYVERTAQLARELGVSLDTARRPRRRSPMRR
jgi:predicted ATPase/class 3 adenylate cyclase